MSADVDYDTLGSGFESLVADMQKKLIDSMHKASIIPPKKDGLWRTTVYAKDGDGNLKRKDSRSKTEEGLYQKLYDHYVGPGSL